MNSKAELNTLIVFLIFFEIILGCTTNLKDELLLKLCDANGDECKTCYGINCNSESSFKSCLQCSASDWFCGANPQNAKVEICKEYRGKCFTTIGNNDNRVARGCLPAENTKLYVGCMKNPDRCKVCINSDENCCNNETVVIETCVDCESNSTDAMCKTQPNLHKNKLCNPFTMSTNQQRGCYLRIVSLFCLIVYI